MHLSPGSRIGSFEVVGVLGAGGMGEVYRARDTKLGRDVALKVLPETFLSDPDRLMRFEREAKTLAALNHPHIAQIYGFEQPGTGAGQAHASALVMELVEGEDLAARIAHGPIPIDEGLAIARQIAEALEAAHEVGIIHRDLKPANIKVRPDGIVKVLDFGLAKLTTASPADGSVDALVNSPTITSPALTTQGLILGTAAYMSPEQAKGKPVDKRADIWAFGCVLYEMLTGKRAFQGEDISDTLAAVLRGEPDWTAFAQDVPAHVRTLIRRCLEKDRKGRIPDLAVVRFMLNDASGVQATIHGAPAPANERPARRSAWIAVAVLAVAVLAASALATVFYFDRSPIDERVIRFPVAVPDGWSLAVTEAPSPGTPPVTVSPDGTRIAFVAVNEAGTRRLWVRSLDSLEAQELPGTDGAAGPFWSPDSRALAFFADGKLKKFDITAGRATMLCDALNQLGGAWSPQGFIMFGSSRTGKGLQRVPAAGGVPTVVTMLAQGEGGHTRPSFFPDGRRFFYRVLRDVSPFGGPLYIGSIDSSERTMLMEAPDASNVAYVAGHLLFLRDTTLMAQPFDIERRAPTGEPVPVAHQVLTMSSPPFAIYSASQAGVLAYQTGAARTMSQLMWFDRAGKPLGTVGDPAAYGDVELSPNDRRLTVSILDPERRTRDIWIVDGPSGRRMRFTFDPAEEATAIWSPDGSRIVFNSRRNNVGDLYQRASDMSGPEELLFSNDRDKFPMRWSSDGRFIPFVTTGSTQRNRDVWILPTFGDRKPFPFLTTASAESEPQLAPDGRWMAYVSYLSNSSEVFVAPFPGPGGKWQISTAGGSWPRWRKDGGEIFYLSGNNELMVASVKATGKSFEVHEVRPLFQMRHVTNQRYAYDVSQDGQRFLINTQMEHSGPAAPITVVVNWTKTLKR